MVLLEKKLYVKIFIAVFLLFLFIFLALFLFSKPNTFKIINRKSPEVLEQIDGGAENEKKEEAAEKTETVNDSEPDLPAEKKEESDKKNISDDVFKNVILDVPFASQAPFGNWDDPRKQDGCEEASSIMAMAWVKGKKLTSQKIEDEINAISAFELEKYGNFHDTSAEDTVERIFKDYYGYNNVQAKHNIGAEDIKKELSEGNLIIVPVNGKILANPHYTAPGPERHMLVIKGYDYDKKEFITNDPGTRYGENYSYDEYLLGESLFDYPTGFHQEATEIVSAMIIIEKESNL